MLTTIQRARARLPLTPGERAALKLGQGLALTALMAALVTAGHALEGTGTTDWRRIGFAAGVAALVAVLNALAKYFTAQGDAPLADALALLAAEAELHAQGSTTPSPTDRPVNTVETVGANDAKTPVSAPTTLG